MLVPPPSLLHWILAALIVLVPDLANSSPSPKTYHVRPDGGNAQQCNGLADKPYVSSEHSRDCAWSNPMVALPSDGASGGAPLIAGGDTLEIAPGEYMVGYGAPGSERCYKTAPWDCRMASPPSGPSPQAPTRIIGKGAAACSAKPQIWGTERTFSVLMAKKVENIAFECLEITDHSDCVANGNHPMRCPGAIPYGPWAVVGLWLEDVKNVTLRQLDIHGLANGGVVAGRVRDMTVQKVRIAANPMAGWDGELYGFPKDSWYAGDIVFDEVLIEWNGCSETFPGNKPTGCFGQSAGGYGDGMGFAKTGGNFTITNSIIRNNTSDGIDLLYHTEGGKVRIDRTQAQANAGNQIKAVGAVTVTNSVILGNCAFFKGKPFTHNVDHCRAMGDALVVSNIKDGEESHVENNTIVSGGNVTILAGGPGSSRIVLRNNVVIALPNALYPKETGADIHCANGDGSECAPWPRIERHNDTVINTRNRRSYCNGPGVRCLQGVPRPYGLTAVGEDHINPRLPPGSPHRDSGAAVSSRMTSDFYGQPRVIGPAIDRGAVEAPP